jgi:hemerythrin
MDEKNDTEILTGKGDQVTWSSSYSMGIKKIDDQHKGLLDFVNDLFRHVTGDEYEERAYFYRVIQHALQYVKNHFSTEEKIMVATKFPGYDEHKKIHDEFTMTVAKSIQDFKAGKKLVLENFAEFLKNWVLTHIATVDTQYAVYFRKIATRKADGKLSITKSDVA